ncbi:MAG: hypothetical protein V2I97_12570 [Desulfococcaceae bacterium]|jgi:hypothetical protein|nr:hypothetical protein [Desulfococcaceae bacterium]
MFFLIPRITGIVYLFLSIAVYPAYAAAEAGSRPEIREESEENGFFDLEEHIDETHEIISDYILSSAQWLDSFFEDKRFVSEENRTRLKVRISAFSDTQDGFDIGGGASLRLVLPKLKKRWNIVVSGSSADEDYEDTKESSGNARKDFVKDDDNHFTIALQYFAKTTERNNIKIESGLRWRDNMPVFFAGPRFRWYKQISGSWALRFTQRFRWYTDEGFYIKSIFDAERPLGDKFFFRSSAEGKWEEGEEGYEYSFGLGLYHAIGTGRALEYQLSTNFETRPVSVLDEAGIRIRYRQKIWRKWLTLEISPQISFPREENYDIVPGILLQLEAVFGKI